MPHHDDLPALIRFLDDAGWNDVVLETPEYTLRMSRSGLTDRLGPVAAEPSSQESVAAVETAPRPAAVPADEAAPEPIEAPVGAEGETVITAPSVGIFWYRPKPGADPFVQVGDEVDADGTVGVLEVMKLFTSVKTESAGTVIAIHVGDGEMVEHGQPLVTLRSSR